MPPFINHYLQHRDFDLNAPSAAFESVWASPSNYAFTILLLLGGDVVSRALAQLAGSRITPVAFSFGWVSYATTAINSAIGENKLMPQADTPCTVINASNGQSRVNGSWVLGRAMRDFEYWMGDPVRSKVLDLKNAKWAYDKEQATKQGKDVDKVGFPAHAGLVVSFWTFDSDKKERLQKPGRDLLFWSGIVVAILQLGLSAIPLAIYGNWGVLLVTASAILLCFLTGCQAQWRREKWACRRIEPGQKRTYIMTRGNGAQHAIVIECDGCGLNLEDLCTGFDNLDSPAISLTCRLFMVALGIAWVVLLITSSALSDQSWFLIAVGGIGMLQNIFVAGWSRRPEALGLPLKFKTVIGSPKVSAALIEAERTCPKVGRALVGTFFPGGLFPSEEKELSAIEADVREKKRKVKDRKDNIETHNSKV
ncbi:Nn.00g106080.m01.CDS01 [Neocucurbitaria sp. VM-36]